MTTQYVSYDAPPVCEREVLRYAGVRGQVDAQTYDLLRSCLDETAACFRFTAVYSRVPLTMSEGECAIGALRVRSQTLATHCRGCDEAIVMAATVGVEIDRLIMRYSRLSPARAVMLQALGAERIEVLMDTLCADLRKRTGRYVTPRFSPGYGDVPLTLQRDILTMLDGGKRLGITLSDSLLMSPSKSVTAFAGLSDTASFEKESKCSRCDKTDCAFRGGV